MALPISSLPSRFTKILLPLERRSSFLAIRNFNDPCSTQCRASNKDSNHSQTILRRSAHFKPSIWNYDYIQSLSSEYEEEIYAEQRRVLREEVRMMLCKVENQLDQLELIDVLQRLGVAYHFNNEIMKILDNIYNMGTSKKKNLNATALEFRLLRQHGYDISTDVFVTFQDETGNFKKCQYADVEGMLSLYEASFHSLEEETILDEARDFTSEFLKEYLHKNRGNDLSLLISHALELPLHWRIPRWEAKWFINVYERRQNMSPALLHFAKLDFNIVQTIYQEELKYTSRWDPKTVESLPYYMKICFLALYNFVNELAFETLKENGYYIIPYLKKAWADICKSYFIEAKWYYSGYTPSLEEYLDNAWISISAPVILVHAYFLVPNSFRKEDLFNLEEYPNLIHFSAMLLRLANDLGTYKRENETGDVPKSIQCYMNETGASEAEAREYIKSMICAMWKKMNGEARNSSLSRSFIDTAINLARMALCMYQHGDGHTIQDPEIRNRILSLIIQPIPVVCTEELSKNND